MRIAIAVVGFSLSAFGLTVRDPFSPAGPDGLLIPAVVPELLMIEAPPVRDLLRPADAIALPFLLDSATSAAGNTLRSFASRLDTISGVALPAGLDIARADANWAVIGLYAFGLGAVAIWLICIYRLRSMREKRPRRSRFHGATGRPATVTRSSAAL